MHDVHAQRFQDSNERRDWQLLLQVIYFVNKYEAMFSTEQLRISKCTWIKCLLEINLAFSVKPSIVLHAISGEGWGLENDRQVKLNKTTNNLSSTLSRRSLKGLKLSQTSSSFDPF